MNLADDAGKLAPDLISLRRRLHRTPEVGLELPLTQRTILAELSGLELEVSEGPEGLSSVTAVLRGRDRGAPAVLLRADMDALPLDEESGEDFSSERPGAMHACGHDLHVAALVGAARLLEAHRESLAGDVVFMFQPGEEGYDGAGHMIENGVLSAAGRPVAAAYGLHVRSSQTPRGHFAGRSGTLMAASDSLDVRVVGVGGHASMPFAATDPIPAAAEMVLALQAMVTRTVNPFDPVVVTVGLLQAGVKSNIIPGDARLGITIRSFSPSARERVRHNATRVLREIAAAHDLTVDIDWTPGYPATVNHPGEFDFVMRTIAEMFGAARFEHWEHPIFGSEDFSRVLEAVPGAYVFLGACAEEAYMDAPSNHSARAVFDDSVVPDAAALLGELAMRRVRE